MVFSVGLTGNLASGKSTVAELFAELGVMVISADKVSKALTAKNTTAYNEIVIHFGSSLLLDNGEINRRQLRELIFLNPAERLWLETLLHPLIRLQIEQQINLCTTPYCIVEIPLLFDRNLYPYLNRILVITAPQETQIARVMARDHCTKEHALAILSTQPESNQRIKIADDVINNNSGLSHLKQQVNILHNKYLNELELLK